MIEKLKQKVDQHNKVKTKLEVYTSIKNQTEKELEDHKKELQEIFARVENYGKVNDIFVSFSESYKKLVIDKIEALITDGLQTIMQNKHIYFRFKVETKRNNLDISFKIFDDIVGEETDLLFGESGGVKNIVAILLRVILIILSTPNPAPIVLDEVGVGISEEYQENFGTFLSDLSHKLGIQIIFITHINAVAGKADSVITVTQSKGVSQVRF